MKCFEIPPRCVRPSCWLHLVASSRPGLGEPVCSLHPPLGATGRLLVCDPYKRSCWNRCVWCQAATCSCFSRVDAGHGWIVQPASVGILKPKCSPGRAPPPQPRPAGMSSLLRPASTRPQVSAPTQAVGPTCACSPLTRACSPLAVLALPHVRVLSAASVCLLRPNVLQICTLKIIGLFACYSTLRDLKYDIFWINSH